MNKSLPFARLVNLIKAIEELPIPMEAYSRHRAEYDYILGYLCLAESRKELTPVTIFTRCTQLGSQPTINKRLQELKKFGLIDCSMGDDRRQKMLRVSAAGHQYLEKCSELMHQAIT